MMFQKYTETSLVPPESYMVKNMEKDGNKTLNDKKSDVSCIYVVLLFPMIMIFQRVGFGLPGIF